MVTLRPIDDSNREAVEALEVSPGQQRFVSNVADSLLEAAVERDGRALYWAVYADETPVGFVMISDEVGGPGYIPHYLWKLFIDEHYQRRGYGTATLDLIVEYFRDRPGVEVHEHEAPVRARAAQSRSTSGTASSRPGEIVFDNEVLLRLELR